MFFNAFYFKSVFLADYAVQSAIGIILLSVCLSVCLSDAVHCGTQACCGGQIRTVMFLAEDFLLTSSDVFAVGCII